MKVTLVAGIYYAGLNGPDFSAFKNLHGIELHFFPRSSQIPVNPKVDPGYRNKWDRVATWIYPGQQRTVDVPRQWAWMVVVPKDIERSNSRKPRTIEIASVLIGLGILWSRLRK